MPQMKLTTVITPDRLVLIGKLWKIKAYTMLASLDKDMTLKQFLHDEIKLSAK
jgi:hypothetical protein